MSFYKKRNAEQAKRFKKLRESLDTIEKDCTQADLAKKLNITKTQISELENGKRDPSVTELKVYSKFFGVQIEYLLCLNSSKTPKNYVLGKELLLNDMAINWLDRSKNFDLKYANIINDLLGTEEGLDLLEQMEKTFYRKFNCFVYDGKNIGADISVSIENGNSYTLNTFDLEYYGEMSKLFMKMVEYKKKIFNNELTPSNVPKLKKATIKDKMKYNI